MHFKIRTNLIILLGFALILVIMATLTAIWLSHISTTNHYITEITKDQEKSEFVFAMRDAASQRALSLYRMSILADPFEQDEEYLKFRKQAEHFIKARMALVEIGETEQELAAWHTAKPMVQKGTTSQTLVADIIVDGDITTANKMMANIIIPIQNQVLTHLTYMLSLQKTQLTTKLADATAENKRVYIQVALLGIFALVIGTIIAFFVIRTSTRSEQKLIHAQQKSQEANQHKSLFLANMSHELRTPLNAIIGYSEMLGEEAEEWGKKCFSTDLKKIRSSGQHLLNLINDILDISKIEAGKMELYPEHFNLATLVTEVSSTLQPLTTKNENHLQIEISEFNEAMYTDLTKLRQTLFNLLSNASKFTNQGEVSLNLSRFTVQDKPWIRLDVKDTGIGLTEKQMNKLFIPFSQADASTTRNFGGTGLGLSISKRLCKMIGGDISVTSQTGMGSTFTITIPTKFTGHTTKPLA